MPIAFDVVNQIFVEVYTIPFINYMHIYLQLILFHENFDLITNLCSKPMIGGSLGTRHHPLRLTHSGYNFKMS